MGLLFIRIMITPTTYKITNYNGMYTKPRILTITAMLSGFVLLCCWAHFGFHAESRRRLPTAAQSTVDICEKDPQPVFAPEQQRITAEKKAIGKVAVQKGEKTTVEKETIEIAEKKTVEKTIQKAENKPAEKVPTQKAEPERIAGEHKSAASTERMMFSIPEDDVYIGGIQVKKLSMIKHRKKVQNVLRKWKSYIRTKSFRLAKRRVSKTFPHLDKVATAMMVSHELQDEASTTDRESQANTKLPLPRRE